ncbi:PD-(D/E)XK motif protein [Gemmatimonadota bacterium]
MAALGDVDLNWGILIQQQPEGQRRFVVAGTSIEQKTGEVLIAIDGSGFRHLLIPVEKDLLIREDRRSAGVQIIEHRLVDMSVETLFVDLVCLKPHLNTHFDALIREVLDELKGSTDNPSHICTDILSRWRELLRGDSGGLLSREAQVGLFGELYHLREIVKRNPDSVDSWVGPDGHRHDFERGDLALEVKCSVGTQGRFPEIHGHEQLEAEEGMRLMLAYLRIEQSPDSGESIPDLIDDILSAGAGRSALNRKLTHIGYSDAESEAYKRYKWRVRESLVYEVDDSLPRVVNSSFQHNRLPAGVLNLRYQIDLTGNHPAPLESDELDKAHTVLAGLSEDE